MKFEELSHAAQEHAYREYAIVGEHFCVEDFAAECFANDVRFDENGDITYEEVSL